LFAVMEAYLHGVSTRSVDDLVVARGAATGIPKSEVSRIEAVGDRGGPVRRVVAATARARPERVLRAGTASGACEPCDRAEIFT
jgi:hypothetical protein